MATTDNDIPATNDEREDAFAMGDHAVPAELLPALALFQHLVMEGERLPTERVQKYLNGSETTVAVFGDGNFTFIQPNLTRRGVSFAYAMQRLYYILLGTDKAPEVPKAR